MKLKDLSLIGALFLSLSLSSYLIAGTPANQVIAPKKKNSPTFSVKPLVKPAPTPMTPKPQEPGKPVKNPINLNQN